MKDQSKTKQVLIQELTSLREKITELEQSAVESRQTAEALRESDAIYRLAFESTSDGIFTIDRNFNISSITPSVERQLGYKVEDVINRPIQDLNILTSESLTRAVSDVIQVLSGAELTGKVYEFIAKDGTRKIGEVTGTPIIQEGRIIGVTAIVRDITERKRAEDALKKSEEQYRILTENSPSMIYLLDVEGNVLLVNQKSAAMLGVKSDAIIGRNIRDLFPERIAERHKHVIDKVLRDGKIIQSELFESFPTGERWIDARIVPVWNKEIGKIIALLGISHDITDRKRIEEALRESDDNYRNLFDNANEAIFVAQDGKLVFINPMTTRMIGYSGEDIMSRSFIEFIHPDDRGMVIDRHVRRIRGEELPHIYSFRIIRREGKVIWVELNTVVVKWKGKPATLNFLSDITERKHAEEERKLSEARLTDAQAVAKVGSWETDLSNLKVIWSEETYRIFEIDPDSFQSSHPGFLAFVHPEDRAKVDAAFVGSIDKHSLNAIEHRIVTPSGLVKFIEERWRVFHDDQGLPVRAVGTCQDVTDRKQADEKIQASLREKETMLKEIHHRVKNNLQVISSLLNMQSSYLHDEKAKEALWESVKRIGTMALIHTQLYQSQDLTRVDFGSFIQDLIGNISQSYGRVVSPVEIHVDAGEIDLGIDTSIPCGLILNELISNALKHAFPEGKEGEINIRMRSEESRVVLTVQDNGIGFPKSIDFTNVKSLGLELVNILVGQMNGKIDMQVDGGTKWTVTFPVKDEREWRNG